MNNVSTKQVKNDRSDSTIVYMDIGVNNKKIGRLVIELYDSIVPKTVNNFKAFIKGYNGYSYKGCNFHRIIPGFCLQGGDLTNNDGSGGISIYGDKFKDENFVIKHDRKGILSMANSGPNTNSSQFFITLNETPHLDKVHVAFGGVINDNNILSKFDNIGSESGVPVCDVVILDCGFL